MSIDQELEDRIRRALRARADALTARDLPPAVPPPADRPCSPRKLGGSTRSALGPGRWSVPLAAAAAVITVVAGTSVAVQALRGHRSTQRVGDTSTSATGPSSAPRPASSAAHSSASSAPSASRTASAPAGPAGSFELRYEPLWPFADYAAAERWRTGATGTQPWHLDAETTALSFTHGYLGLTELDRVTSSVLDAGGAHVGVGYRNPAGQAVTAAVLHLVRFGPRPDAGWEVVGSDDTTFSLERPAYGAGVASPLVAGGHITGVDDNIRIWIRSTDGSTGVLATIPAGGRNAPWSSPPLPFRQRGVLIIVASTGGHVQQVERFAIQGVHTGG